MSRIDAFLKELRVSRNFSIITCAAGSLNAATLFQNGLTGGMSRMLALQTDMEEFMENPGLDIPGAITFLHALGHHVFQHAMGKTNLMETHELDADYFSGSSLARLGLDPDQAFREFAVLLKNEATYEGYPPFADRLASFKRGWEWGAFAKSFGWGEDVPVYGTDRIRAEGLRDAGSRKEEEGDLASAAEDYLDAYAYNWRVTGNLRKALHCVQELGDDDLALKIYGELLASAANERAPANKQAYLYDMATHSGNLGQFDQARTYLQISRDLNAGHVDDLVNTGKMYLRMDRPGRARDALMEAIQLGPATGEMYLYLGQAQSALSDPKAAIRSFRTVLSASPENLEAILGLSEVYSNEAEALLGLIEQEKSPAEARRLQSVKISLYREAEAVLLEGLRAAPDDLDLLTRLYRIYLSIPDKSRIREIRKKLKDIQE
ncbi:hypothetical protein [Robiginitalea sp. SC105]|uniref:hypothetical protein n=1 Tax=Robiginitalea sp. SC105 TaxID=2762332 RepID=UPI001639F83F|nr:hypothetical protein [Robiginitalea sp. SC105]MBC2838376.1 hypothetical protein [Robiginitalea sp. SC105]